MIALCQSIGANICQRDQDIYFLSESLASFNVVMLEQVITTFKAARCIVPCWDIGGHYLLIRFACHNERFKPVTHFWQARLVATKTAKSLCKAIIAAFTKKQSPLLDEKFTIAEAAFLGKLEV